MGTAANRGCRSLVIVLGDQLSFDTGAFDGFDPRLDRTLMAEVEEESEHVPSHKARIALFLAAMRHFASEVLSRGWPLDYLRLEQHPFRSLSEAMDEAIVRLQPERIVLVEPGDWRVREGLLRTARSRSVRVDLRSDRTFAATVEEFQAWARGRRRLVQEHWYRHLRLKSDVLMEGASPVGGQWNFDAQNRESFGSKGPGLVPRPVRFLPDATTREVLNLVQRRFASHPGELSEFDWPVDRRQALEALNDFVQNRLPSFGRYQDAMWEGEPFLFHSRLSAALNLKLLHPMEVVRAAEREFREGRVSLPAAEGFIRQILGWREYVRGLYHLWMPEWLGWNALDARLPLPEFYWTAETEMRCLREAIAQTLRLGYAHHIQRLMVTGLFAMLLGVRPVEVHRWYLAIYVDAVEWVELPNTLGMSQYADGGRMATKPYAASGRYIQRMSNHCSKCRFRPDRATGEEACPFTTLYWDFLARNEHRLANNLRMRPALLNLRRLSASDRVEIRRKAEQIGQCPP